VRLARGLPLTGGGARGAALAALLAIAGCTAPAPARPAGDPCAECIAAQRTNGWCERCERGYVGGVPIPSALLHEALDAHGHEIDPSRMACLECVEMIERDGFCTRCRFGFVGGQLYFTELTWTLHRGTLRLEEELDCPECRAVHGGVGSCASCGALWVGNVEFEDPELFARASREFHRLESCVALLAKCEYCAVAEFFQTSCPRCSAPLAPPR
jgi:hypothetical protein